MSIPGSRITFIFLDYMEIHLYLYIGTFDMITYARIKDHSVFYAPFVNCLEVFL